VTAKDTISPPWGFMSRQIPLLFRQYAVFFDKNDSCIDYFLEERSTHRHSSGLLTLSHEIFTGNIYVSKFYPEIYRKSNCRYLSAACFYLMVHHAVAQFSLADRCHVNLETDLPVFNNFYSRLNDFDFKIFYRRPCNRVYLRGTYHQYPFRAAEGIKELMKF